MSLMALPEHVRQCMDILSRAGHRVFLVGGCVRDALLGLVPHDFDLCSDALPEQKRQLFVGFPLVLTGLKHGTVGVITGGEVVEITTFRTECGYSDNRHPDSVAFTGTIEEDLRRRDFTVNAIAWHPDLGFVDPFSGRVDLERRVLRAVGDPEKRLQEDSLRILRGVRFAVRFSLTPEENTFRTMEQLAGLMDNLAAERVFDELCKLIPLVTAADLLRFGRILAAAIPELDPMLGFDQRCPPHAYDLFTHTAHVVEAVPPELPLRWAALLHDVGKIPTFTQDENGRGHFQGHASVSASMADTILRRLKAPTQLREQAVNLISHHMTRLEPDKKLLRRRLSRMGWNTVQDLLLLQEADMGSKGTGKPEEMEQFAIIRHLLEQIRAENACLTVKDLAGSGRDLMELGFAPGPALGKCLDSLLSAVLEETLPNDRSALLDAARDTLNRT